MKGQAYIRRPLFPPPPSHRNRRIVLGRTKVASSLVDRTRPSQIAGWTLNSYNERRTPSELIQSRQNPFRCYRHRYCQRRNNRGTIMSNANIECSSSSIMRVFSRDNQDNCRNQYYSNNNAPPDVSWDETSSSTNMSLQPCLKVLTQEDSLKYSYYPFSGGFEPISYRIDFSNQTIYHHDLSVQELRGPNNERETSATRVHGIALRSDPWKVTVSTIPTETESTSCSQRKARLHRWSRVTRENVWHQYCQEKRQEEEMRLYKELRLTEGDLQSVTGGGGGGEMDTETQQKTKQTLVLQQSLDAMEEVW